MMFVINIVLFIFFILIGGLGAFYAVEPGVFVGLTFAPWQFFKMGYNNQIYLLLTLICAAGGTFFLINMGSSWVVLILFVFLQLFNLWKYFAPDLEKENHNQNSA